MGREKEGTVGMECPRNLQETQNAKNVIYSRNFQSQHSFYMFGKPTFGSRSIQSKTFPSIIEGLVPYRNPMGP